MSGESEKALRYISQLDTARCNAQWDQIPELTRKVVKHAPQRKCLVLTAQTEAQVADYVPSASSRPGTAATATAPAAPTSALSKLITPLLAAIDAEQTYPEDAFQATVCLGWIHWVLREPQLAITKLPKDIMQDFSSITEKAYQSKAWMQVCLLKGAYIKGFSQEKTLGPEEGLETYRSLASYMALLANSLGSYSPEFRLWAERMLSRMVAVAMKSKPLGEWMDLQSMLQMFHLWISLFKMSGTNQGIRQAPSTIELGLEVDYSRWDVWMAYYDTLSEVLLRGYIYSPNYTEKHPELLYSTDGLRESEYLSARLRQRTELKQVEASIETKLMEETRFPKATERNSRVERWVDAVMQNWRIMCGPTWHDDELGEGGKNAIARGVLDILYRAATKTFHSTQILRFLFNVHAYVTEFDLAFKAFDSYIDLLQRGKDREDKTGEPDYSLDNDDTTLHTVAEAIRILCRFGDRKDVEKAREVSQRLQNWTQRATAEAEAQENVDADTHMPVRIPVSPKTVAETYRALGICEATWARLTYDGTARNAHQQKAVDHFRTSLKISFGNTSDLETSYSLALVLAEMRELSAAIKVVKQAMSWPGRKDFLSPMKASGSADPAGVADSSDFGRERKLIAFWHLLTLLLTAKADLGNAARTSNAAFEQFEDYSNLFGPEPAFKSEHLQELEKPAPVPTTALVDRMARYEKEGIVQVKMTQIAIKEVLQSATEAVDSSAELLALYSRLFGDPRDELRQQKKLAAAKPPKSGVSLRNSVLGRISRSRSKVRRDEKNSSVPSLPTIPNSVRPTTVSTSTLAPTIQVTDEDRRAPKQKYNTINGGSPLVKTKSQQTGTASPQRAASVKLQKREPSLSRKSAESSRPPSSHTVQTQNGNARENTTVPRAQSVRSETKSPNFSLPRPSTALSDATSGSPDQPLRTIPHNLDRLTEPPPPGHFDQPPKQDIRLPAPHPSTGDLSPEPAFSILQERRHKLSLLIELWLFIAGLYTRATVFDDAKAAIDEASELVQTMETQLAQETSSAKAFATRGWGGAKSIEELWGSVWAARGELAVAQELPYDAIAAFEKALSHFPDHPTAIVGLSNLLLDIASEKITPEAPELPIFQDFLATSSIVGREALHPRPTSTLTRQGTNSSIESGGPGASSSSKGPSTGPTSSTSPSNALDVQKLPKEPSPEELNRLAARDRAYSLLSSLTKLGSGWDYAEAWFALSRSYELSGQMEKAKEVLWWCVELEDTRPIRGWEVVKVGAF